MKNIMKILFVLVSSFSVIGSASAGDLSVTGSAKATYNMAGSDSATAKNEEGKAIGITNEITFTGTGELDNGMSWKWQTEMDPDAGGATQSDDTRLELTTDIGMIGIYNTEGQLSTKYKAAQSAYGIGSDNGAGGGIVYGAGMNSYNNIQYHTPSGMLPYGVQVKVGYSPGDSTEANGAGNSGAVNNGFDNVKQYQLTATPIDGLNVGASYLTKDTNEVLTQKYENGGAFATYAYGPVTIGYSEFRIAPNSGTIGTVATTTAATELNTKTFRNKMVSVGFAVNDQFSISYDVEKSNAEKTTIVLTSGADTDNHVELEITSLQAAYNIGGATVAITLEDIENDDYILAKDQKETIISLAMAF
jgi:hypothetical protein